MQPEIIGAIVSVVLGGVSLIGYRTRTDVRSFLATGLVILQAGAELLYDLSVVLKNIKLVEKPALPGLPSSYAIEFGNDVSAVKSLNDIPNHVREVIGKIDELSKAIPNLGSILPKK